MRLGNLPRVATELRILLLVPPVEQPYGPSLTVPYLVGQMCEQGFLPTWRDLNAEFYCWLFRQAGHLGFDHGQDVQPSVLALQDPVVFFDRLSYQESMSVLNGYLEPLSEGDGLPYALAGSDDIGASPAGAEELVDNLGGSLLEGFLGEQAVALQGASWHVIGFSTTSLLQLASAIQMARLLKKRGCEAHLVLGGHALSLVGQAVAQEALLQCFDAIVMSGGADVMAEVCADLVESSAQRIYGGGKSDGTFSTIRLRGAERASGDTPGWYLSPEIVHTIFSAVGCSYGQCSFCASNRRTVPFLPRRPVALADEVERLRAEHGARHFEICDNNFDPTRMAAFATELKHRGLIDIAWKCTSRIYSDMDLAFLRHVRGGGCALISMGLESASDRVLGLMRKGYTCTVVSQVLENLERVGLPVHLYCICGYPGETMNDSLRTVDFLVSHSARFHSAYFQDYDSQLAASVFAPGPPDHSTGLCSVAIIERLSGIPEIRERFAVGDHKLRRHGYPLVDSHDFLYLANHLREERLPTTGQTAR